MPFQTISGVDSDYLDELVKLHEKYLDSNIDPHDLIQTLMFFHHRQTFLFFDGAPKTLVIEFLLMGLIASIQHQSKNLQSNNLTNGGIPNA